MQGPCAGAPPKQRFRLGSRLYDVEVVENWKLLKGPGILQGIDSTSYAGIKLEAAMKGTL